MKAYFERLAAYNAWANARLYASCAELAPDEYARARPSFFGSIHRTLNHILVGDRHWFGRIEGNPPGYRLDEELYRDFAALRAAREAEDARIVRIVGDMSAERLAGTLAYRNVKGEPFTSPMALVLGHAFNHATHHRGQVHGMLSQTQVAPPPLDLMYFVRES